ncbi:MAG: class A beta-lactamase-related serine hydrolase [Acidobacteria bacterium]|nr:class A beta-lactamase-related serine hydrolase [Acidobacteriota bacterium]
MRLLFSLLLAGSLSAASTAVNNNDAAQTGLDPARLAQISVRMKQFVDKGAAAGIVMLVARHGKVAALDAVGYTDLETRQPIKADAIFQIHSMTKPIVALAAMMLAEEGRLSIGDPVEKYLPEFRGQWMVESRSTGTMTLRRPDRLVTLRDLMTHTSGMSPNPPEAIKELHGALHKTLADVVLVESQQPLEFDPGTKWQYSNNGIAALARIIEVVSGLPFEKFLEARIFQPLGMKDTYIVPPKEKHHRMPTAYLLKDGKPLKYTADPLGEGLMKFREGAKYSLPEGGVYSTASDLYLLYQMMLNKGRVNGVRLLSPASVELMTRNHTGDLVTSQPGTGWGLGWFVIKDGPHSLSLLSPGSYGHGGRYGTFCFIDPQKDLIGIFMIHREGGSDERQAFVAMAESAVIE